MVRLRVALLLAVFLAFSSPAFAATDKEWIVLVGGPSMHQWEQYKAAPHDHWWANFIHAARLRTEQMRAQLGPDAKITWLVYKQGYQDRAKQEHQDLLGFIQSVADKFHLNLVYFDKGGDVIDYLNSGQPRNQVRVAGFEYFGHSNRACFMFDYSNNIDSACKAWLHEDELNKINRRIFSHDAVVRSWGCHTGESMSRKWYVATGTHMWGVVGKTQYMMEELPIISSANGKWVN